MKLMETLLRVLFPPRGTQSRIDTLSLESLGSYVEPVTFMCNGVEITSLLPYREPLVRALIVEAKFHEHAHAHAVLGTLLAEHIQSLLEDMAFDSVPLILVPIPLSPRRLRERGYNQSQKILAVAIQSLPSVEYGDKLLRTRDTVPQTTLSRSARLRNVEHAFALREPVDPAHTYVLIDDVTTTGATLSSAARVFQEHGARRLHVLALAH